jgi:hypothetical protein
MYPATSAALRVHVALRSEVRKEIFCNEPQGKARVYVPYWAPGGITGRMHGHAKGLEEIR